MVLKKTPQGEQRACLKDTHELFTPSDKRRNESDREMETETKGQTDRRRDRREQWGITLTSMMMMIDISDAP